MGKTVTNFGHNLRFTPRHVFAPRDEGELLRILDEQRGCSIRVVGSKHAWSDGIITKGVLIDLGHLRQVETVQDSDGETWATIGGGCQIKHILTALYKQANVTLPAIGLIAEQTIAGATATGTHGSGRHSISHYLAEVRVATYDPQTGRACIRTIVAGDELRAARCSLGCLGIVVSVQLRCVVPYHITEVVVRCGAVAEALAMEEESPLQQFYLIPHSWQIFVQRRAVAPAGSSRSWHATFYRLYWRLGLDIAYHLAVIILAAILRSGSAIQFFYRWLFPRLTITGWRVTDRSDKNLLMGHELFRHLELEFFVPRRHVESAATLVREIVDLFSGTTQDVSAGLREKLAEHGLLADLLQKKGTFTQHYVICVRKILPDDTLISMASSDQEPWYSFSFVTYVEPRQPFYAMAELLARCTLALYGGRLHWGKWFPLRHEEISETYPDLETFRRLADKFDPRGVFRNDYTARVLGLTHRDDDTV